MIRPCGCRPDLCRWLPARDLRASRADRLCRRGRALLDAQLEAERALASAPRFSADLVETHLQQRAFREFEARRERFQDHLATARARRFALESGAAARGAA